jgi:hypothetical protein
MALRRSGVRIPMAPFPLQRPAVLFACRLRFGQVVQGREVDGAGASLELGRVDIASFDLDDEAVADDDGDGAGAGGVGVFLERFEAALFGGPLVPVVALAVDFGLHPTEAGQGTEGPHGGEVGDLDLHPRTLAVTVFAGGLHHIGPEGAGFLAAGVGAAEAVGVRGQHGFEFPRADRFLRAEGGEGVVGVVPEGLEHLGESGHGVLGVGRDGGNGLGHSQGLRSREEKREGGPDFHAGQN